MWLFPDLEVLKKPVPIVASERRRTTRFNSVIYLVLRKSNLFQAPPPSSWFLLHGDMSSTQTQPDGIIIIGLMDCDHLKTLKNIAAVMRRRFILVPQAFICVTDAGVTVSTVFLDPSC